jgi:hypothetical protein
MDVVLEEFIQLDATKTQFVNHTLLDSATFAGNSNDQFDSLKGTRGGRRRCGILCTG